MTESENGSYPGSEADSQLARTILRLREMLLAGEFDPGDRISEAPLAARIGVSRTPIRLALERLAHEGLLEPYPTGGFIVRKFTLDDVWNGIEVRGLLEGGAARLAAERLVDERELDALRRYQEELDAIGEPTIETFPAYLQVNDGFHGEILRLAKNETLKGVLDRLLSYRWLRAMPWSRCRRNFQNRCKSSSSRETSTFKSSTPSRSDKALGPRALLASTLRFRGGLWRLFLLTPESCGPCRAAF